MNLDVSRNWSAALSRLGFGSIFLYLCFSSTLIPIDPASFGTDLGNLRNVFVVLVQTFSFFTVTTVIGGALLSVGHSCMDHVIKSSDGAWTDLSEEKMLLRAQRIHELGNPFFASEFRDGRLQVSIAAGLLGNAICAPIFLIVLLFILAMLDLIPAEALPDDAKRRILMSELLGFWGTVLLFLTIILFFALSIAPALKKFQRIDALLFDDGP